MKKETLYSSDMDYCFECDCTSKVIGLKFATVIIEYDKKIKTDSFLMLNVFMKCGHVKQFKLEPVKVDLNGSMIK